MSTQNTPSATAAAQTFSVTRVFDAPRDLVFAAWSKPEHLQQWWGPTDWTLPVCKVDFRVGGEWLYCMHSPDGIEAWGKAVYREISAPERIVYTDYFVDPDGNALPDMPELVMSVEFVAMGKQTKVISSAQFASIADMEKVMGMGMEEGYNQTLDRLVAHLATIKTVTSKDGTRIAYRQFGSGPAVILVNGAMGVRGDENFITPLSERFTVIDYNRRGRGDSSDTKPYAVQREVEDIEALIEAVGGAAALCGFSSGAVLALDAAAKLPGKVTKLVMYEPPFIVNDSRPPVPSDYVEQLNAAIAAGNPGDAVEIFMSKAVLIPAEFVAQMRYGPTTAVFEEHVHPPQWLEMEAVAHTIAYDGMIMGDTMSGKPLQTARWETNTAPTLVITGGNSDAFFHDGAKGLVAGLPNVTHQVLPGQDHAVSGAALEPMVTAFLAS